MGKSEEDITPILIGISVLQASPVDQRGNSIQLSDLIEGRFSVLIFCRGGLCPYCNAKLGEIASVQGKLQKPGHQIFAKSPDGPELLKRHIKKWSKMDAQSVSQHCVKAGFATLSSFEKWISLFLGTWEGEFPT